MSYMILKTMIISKMVLGIILFIYGGYNIIKLMTLGSSSKQK